MKRTTEHRARTTEGAGQRAADALRPAPAAAAPASSAVQSLTVEPDDQGMRVDRFLTARFPQLAFTHVQRIVRKGELRVDGKRVKPSDRLVAGQKVRVPPLRLAEQSPRAAGGNGDAAFLRSITLYEDRDVLVLDKPMGLAVQGVDTRAGQAVP